MSAPIVTFPGKLGDLVYALDVLRDLVGLYRAPATLVITPSCEAAIPLIKRYPGLVSEVVVSREYKPTGDECALQPADVPVPSHLFGGVHRDVLHLGLRRHPLKGETLADAIGSHFQIRSRGGPWLHLARVTHDGHVVTHAPMQGRPLTRETLALWRSEVVSASSSGRRVVLVGTTDELRTYCMLGLDDLPGAELRDCASLADVVDACDGASRFVGVASAPAVVAAGSGLPCDWILRPGTDRRWLPRGCQVAVIG